MARGLLAATQQFFRILSGSVPIRPGLRPLYEFQSAADIARWQVFTDSVFGGQSQACFDLSPEGKTAVFSGTYQRLQDDEEIEIVRSGYCTVNTKVLRYGDYIDLDQHSHLVYRVKGDGNQYIANVRVDNFIGSGGDIWQAPLMPSPGQWQDVKVPFASFARSVQGRLVENKMDLARGKIISLGFAITADASMPLKGDFRLEVASIQADGTACADGVS